MNENASDTVVYSYTRADAIRDGVFVDLMLDPEFAATIREAGFRCPIAVTTDVFERCIALTPAAERAGDTPSKRLWDVAWALGCQIKGVRAIGALEQLDFEFAVAMVVGKSSGKSLVRLCASIEPSEAGEPAITIYFPEER